MKSFNKWLEEDVNKEMKEKEVKDLINSKGLFANNYHDKLTQLYLAYQNYSLAERTKWLVWATWALVIGTLLVLISK